MFGWFGRKPKISAAMNKGKNARFAEIERPVWNTEKSSALLRAPLNRDLYGQALRAKGSISLKAVDEEYGRLVWQRLRPDDSNDDVNDEQRQDQAKVSVTFSPWSIVRGELIRVYGFKNLCGPGTQTKVELRCQLIVEGNKVRPFVHLLVKPHFSAQGKSVASVFAPSDDLDDYKVLIARVESADTGINFVTFDIGDGEHLVNVLKLGREVTIKLAEFESNRLKYIIPHLALSNDATFSDRYDFLKAATLLGVETP